MLEPAVPDDTPHAQPPTIDQLPNRLSLPCAWQSLISCKIAHTVSFRTWPGPGVAQAWVPLWWPPAHVPLSRPPSCSRTATLAISARVLPGRRPERLAVHGRAV